MTDTTTRMGLVYTTWPDEASVGAAARTLLEEGLIACANILGPSTSIYRWEGEVETSREIIALFKTSGNRCETLCARLIELHPYDVPAIIRLGIEPSGSSEAFLSWVEDETAR